VGNGCFGPSYSLHSYSLQPLSPAAGSRGAPTVFVGVLQVELSIPGAFSLKEKRHVLKGLLERLRRDFGVAAAEVDRQDVWNSAIIGAAFVSNDARHAESQLQHALNSLEKNRDAVVADSSIEVF
jgi:uncharacterized protein YlxP (DUF503 family)